MHVHEPDWHITRVAQDHLSLGSVSQNINDQVTPGFATLTNRARYYALYCWILHDYFGGGHEREAFAPFFRRREYAYALACASHYHGPDTPGGYGIVGSRTASRRWKSGEDPLDLSVSHIKTKYGGFSDYRNAMQRVDLLRLSDDQASLTESASDAPSGRALAEAYQRAIEDTVYVKEYRDAQEVPRSVIEEYGEAACLCLMRDAPDSEVLRRALLQPDPQVSDRALRSVHLSRTRSLTLIFDAINHCAGERMDDMAWRKLLFYRSFSKGRPYDLPESLDETALVWRMYQQRELHVYALTSLWSDLLWWLEEYGPATLEERVAALNAEVDLTHAGARFGLNPRKGRPSEVSVRELLNSVTEAAGISDIFDFNETRDIEQGIGRDAACSEKELLAALEWDDTLDAGDYVGTALWLSLVLYARTRHWGTAGVSTTAYITRMGEGRQWSVSSFFAEIDRRRDSTALELLAWIYRNLARQHLTVAMAKMPDDTFRLLYEDGLLYYRAPDWPALTADRYDRMLTICRDLGWVQETGNVYRLTPLGKKARSVGEDAAGLALGLLRVFEDAVSRSALGEAFAGWRRRLENYSPWLFNTKADLGSVTLLSSADGPILPRAAELLRGREVSRLLVVSPFFDREAAALKWLVDHLRPKELRLLATDGVQLDPAQVEATLASADTGRILEFLGNGRPLHGKALLFEGPWGEALLAGSPNLSSAALLRKAGARGNFELATFQEGKAGDFSPLFEDKIGSRVAVADLHPRKPIARSNRVAPLELEAVWVQEGRLHAVPAGRDEKLDTIEVRLERRGAEIARHHLRRGVEGKYTVELGQEELTRLEGALLRACWLGSDDRLGAAVWIQNLDVVKRRANPVQRPRYAGGLQGLSKDALGLDEDAWNNLFDAFLALSKGWGEYAKSFRPEKAPSAKRTSKSGEEKGEQTWDPESFYVTLEDVRIELPAYFARVDNSGWGIGDFEYLISALPTAILAPEGAPTRTPDGGEAPRGEGGDDEGGEDEGGGDSGTDGERGEDEDDEKAKKERRKKIGNRLFRRFRRLVETYEETMQQQAQNVAEATLVSSLYTALHVAFARAATAGILDASRFRQLASRLTKFWTTEVWMPLSSELRYEVESTTGCATISLAAVAAATSLWAREEDEVWEEFDADLFGELARSLSDLRPVFKSLETDLKSGQVPDRWTIATDAYAKLDPARATPLSRFDDLKRRYEVWHLNEKSALVRALEKWEIADVADLQGGILRIHALLPDTMHRKDRLSKLLYLIHEGVEASAAVVWENAQNTGTIRRIALVLVPEQKAVLEVTRYGGRRFLLWRYVARGGTLSGGVSLMYGRSIPSTQVHHVRGDSPDAMLIDRARELVSDLFE